MVIDWIRSGSVYFKENMFRCEEKEKVVCSFTFSILIYMIKVIKVVYAHFLPEYER